MFVPPLPVSLSDPFLCLFQAQPGPSKPPADPPTAQVRYESGREWQGQGEEGIWASGGEREAGEWRGGDAAIPTDPPFPSLLSQPPQEEQGKEAKKETAPSSSGESSR